MGTTLTGTTPQDTYDSLIKVTDNGPLSGTAKYLSDGLGNDSVLALSNARVGVGTTSPSEKLHVEGSISLAYGSSLKAANATYTTLIETGYNGSSDFVSLYTAGNNVANATAKITMLAGGNVGIGTSSPAVKLHSSASYAAPTGGIDANVQILTSNTSGASGINMLASNASVSFLHFGDTDAANVGQIAYTHVNDNMLFVVGGAERVRLTTNGLTFNGDTAAANALDDYEEGTWTMGLSFGGGSTGVTYSANTGTYTKIGRQVTVNGVLVLTSKGSSTGSVLITGLPFTIANFGANYAAAVLRIENISFANQFQAYGGIGSTVVAIDEITEAGVNGSLTDADFANNSTVMISLTYFV